MVTRGNKRVVAAAAGAVCAITLVFASTAAAYTHSWSCSRNSGNTCSDSAGQTYNPWIQVYVQMNPFRDVHELCAKGVTAAGNQRSPASGDTSCDFGVTLHSVCFIGSSPDSLAYTYWDGPGGPYSFDSWAATPASSGC